MTVNPDSLPCGDWSRDNLRLVLSKSIAFIAEGFTA